MRERFPGGLLWLRRSRIFWSAFSSLAAVLVGTLALAGASGAQEDIPPGW